MFIKTVYFMSILLLGVVLGTALMVHASSPTICTGFVQRQEPVTLKAGFDTGYAGPEVYPGMLVMVDYVTFKSKTGEIWYRISGGWVQGYSGYTTGVASVILTDAICPLSLPVKMQ